jgi:hypothetical protein
VINWKGCEGKWSWPNLKDFTSIYLEGLREIKKNIFIAATINEQLSVAEVDRPCIS